MCKSAAVGEGDELCEGVGPLGTPEEGGVSNLVGKGGGESAPARAGDGEVHAWL